MANQDRPGRGSGPGGTALEEVQRRARQVEQSATGGQGVTEQAEETVKKVSEQASETAEEVAREQQRSLATHLGGLGRAVGYAAERLRQEDESWLASYAEQAARGIERFRDSLESQEPREVVNQLEEYGRRSPQAFIEISLLGGFLLGRFLKSSQTRPRQAEGSDQPSPTESVTSKPALAEGKISSSPATDFPANQAGEEVYE
jgi:ElaB/YqjD/DUF883 family membrane-anchored ribosome-binding protein